MRNALVTQLIRSRGSESIFSGRFLPIGLRQRARTTSFLVQLWTWWQCGQFRRGRLSFVPSQADSSTVLPVGARRPVEGQRTRILLIAEPAIGFAARVRSNFVIRVGKQCGLFPGHR